MSCKRILEWACENAGLRFASAFLMANLTCVSGSPEAGAQEIQETRPPFSFAETHGLNRKCASLLSEQLRVPGTAAAAKKSLEECLEIMARLLQISRNPHWPLGANQKKLLFADAERTLFLLREVIERISDSNNFSARTPWQGAASQGHPLLALATSLENQLRLFLQNVHDKETWRASAGLGLGYVHWQDGNRDPLAGARISVLLDQGNTFDAAFDLELASPLREEGGYILFPPSEMDIATVGNVWLEFKRFRQVQFKVGSFPDSQAPLGPGRWPFYTLQAKLTLFKSPLVGWFFNIRHDFLGLYSTRKTESRPHIVERNVPEVTVDLSPLLWSFPVSLRTIYRLHWYTDTEGSLAGLSLGRRKYLQQPAALQGTRYRVQEFTLRSHWSHARDWLDLEATVGRWANILLPSDNSGWMASLAPSIRLGEGQDPHVSPQPSAGAPMAQPTTLRMNFQHAEIGCASLPPVQLAGQLFPGTRTTSLRTDLNFGLGQGYVLGFWGFLQNVSPLSTRGVACQDQEQSWRHTRSHVPRGEVGVTLSYEFSGE